MAAAVHAVILHHRGEAMLGRCLETLLASRDVDLQVVVLANACREPLPAIARESPRVRVVESERSMGFAEGNNFAAAWARRELGPADFYYFLNNDTESEPDALALLVAALARRPAAALAGPRLMIQGAPGHLNSLGLNLTEDGWGWDEGIGRSLADYGPLPGERTVVALTGAAILVDAAVFAEVGGWTELYEYYFEDVDLCLMAQERGREVVHVPDAVVHHRISATMTLGSERKELYFWRNRLLLATVHWPWRLLAALYRRAWWDEIVRAAGPTDLRRRALRGALARLPRLLRARWRAGGQRAWRRHLRPAGSVPVITLPEVRYADGVPPPPSPFPDDAWDAAARLAAAPGDRRLLLLGWSPLPFEDALMNSTPGARLWQLAAALAGAGHAVCAVAARMPGGYDGRARPPLAAHRHDGALYVTLEPEVFAAPGALEQAARAFRPDAVVASSLVPAARAVAVAGELPLWVDLPGDPMAEAQAKAAAVGGEQVRGYRRLLLPVLERGDAFSGVSEAQRLALVGELALAGRLDAANAGRELAATIELAALPGAEPGPGEVDDRGGVDGLVDDLDGVAGEGDFVVLWSGGYNTWCDVETLVAGVERAIEARPEVLFVSTGGDVPGHDEETYRRLRELVARSPRRERFRLLGALPERRAARVMARADLGVLTEKPLYERELGSAGRILRWVDVGLPFVCTRLSPIGAELERAGLAFTYPPGDAAALAERLVAAAADRPRLAAMAAGLRRRAREELTPAAVAEPLLAWASAPRRAADAGRDGAPGTLSRELAELEARLAEMEALYHQTRHELGRIHHSKMWKVWMTALRLRRPLGP